MGPLLWAGAVWQWAIFSSVLAALIVLEVRNRGVSKTLRMCFKKFISGLVAYIESRGGVKLITVDESTSGYLLNDDAANRTPFLCLSPPTSMDRRKHAAKDRSMPIDGDITPPSSPSGSGTTADPWATSAEVLGAAFGATIEESKLLFERCLVVKLSEGQELFRVGDSSKGGAYAVVTGEMGMWVPQSTGGDEGGAAPAVRVAILRNGEAIGKLDLLDGAPRSFTCRAHKGGCELVQMPRAVFLEFVSERPHLLKQMLTMTLARSWRIGHFILKDYLQMPLDGTAFPTGSSAREISSSEAAALAEAMLVTSTETDANPATLPTMLSTKLSMRPSSMTGSRQLHSILRRKGDLEPRRTRAGVSFTVSEGSMSVESSMSTCSMEANPSKESEAPEEPFTRLASIYEACLAGGWDVVAPHESGLASATLSWAKDAAGRAVRRVVLDPGGVLYDTDHMVQEFYILLEGPLVIERRISERKCIEAALIPVGSLVAAGAFLSATSTRGKVWAGTQRCVLVAIGEKELAVLMGAPPIRTNSSGSVPPPDFVTPVPAAVVGDRGGLARNSPFALSFVMEESASEVLAAGPDILDTSPSEDSSALAKQPSDAEQRTVSLAVDLLLAASRSLSPMARHFASLGLRQVWYSAGEVVYRQGDLADALYVVISGRARMVYSPPSGTGKMTIEGEAGRGDTIGALLTLNGSTHNTTCLCARDLEAVRMTQASFELLTVARPKAAARVLQGMAQRLAMGVASSHRGSAVLAGSSFPVNVPVSASSTVRDIATIAILPAGITDDDTAGQEVVASLAHALSMELESAYGRTTLVDSDMIKKLFPDEVDLLDTPFFRAKVTAWLSKKEEDSRFIILQGDASNLAWSKICADQADCCLLAASPWYTDPDIGPLEDKLVWHSAKRSMALTHKTVSMLHRTPEALSRWADASLEDHLAEVLTTAPVTEDGFKDLSSLRRVELVLVYARGDKPEGTSAWLDQRPLLTRHHHIRLHRPGDLARLGRWMAGRAVGIVFSGGGSRGLAHLGVLQALKEAEVPVDVLGGTSQGAFMAGLAAHDFDLEELKARVKKYADHVGSVWNILWDLTPPLLAVLTGGGLNKGVKLAYSDGCSKIEDLWLRFFCVTTNLTAGKAHVHERGTLWRAVRASMSLIGLVPPVVVDGQVLCDGGYSDNLPVDAVRQMGVATVIVVDVEDRDQSAWAGMTPSDGVMSGWKLIWNEWCPVPSWRFKFHLPGKGQMVSALTWMAHQSNLARLTREGHTVDLYLRPPVLHYKLLDYRLMDKILEQSLKYASKEVTNWQQLLGDTAPGREIPSRRRLRRMLSRNGSMSCMTQLQFKQTIDTKGGFSREPELSSVAENGDRLMEPLKLLKRAATGLANDRTIQRLLSEHDSGEQ